jgi:hypothetical protein
VTLSIVSFSVIPLAVRLGNPTTEAMKVPVGFWTKTWYCIVVSDDFDAPLDDFAE